MRSSIHRLFAATLLSCALVSPSLVLRAQDAQTQPATRPRRASAPDWPTTTPKADEALTLPKVEPEPVRLSGEPVIRIGLATAARSVTVSTTAPALDATEAGVQPLPLELARVRVEARSYPQLPQPMTDGGSVTEMASASAKTPVPPNNNA